MHAGGGARNGILRPGTRVRLVAPSPRLRLRSSTGHVVRLVQTPADPGYEVYVVRLDVAAHWIWPDGLTRERAGQVQSEDILPEVHERRDLLDVLPDRA